MKRFVLLVLAAVLPCAGQSTISTSDRDAYAANAGWIDFRPSAAGGVVIFESFLSGKAYAANFGWISLGDGTPDNGHTYSNSSTGDFGVNLSPAGLLTGRAYSANCGWINFEQTHGQPRLDLTTGKFSGYAYGANIGWVTLDMPGADLVTTTIFRPDSDADGIPDAWEMLHFDGSLTIADGITDADGDGFTDLEEYRAGTEPHDATSFFHVLAYSTDSSLGFTELTFTTAPGRLYSIQQHTDLAGIWSDSGLGVFIPDSGPSTTKTVIHPPTSKRFFRALVARPLTP